MACYPLLQCEKCLVRRKEALGAFWPAGLTDTEGQVRKKKLIKSFRYNLTLFKLWLCYKELYDRVGC